MESDKKRGYWKTMCSTLEVENQNLKKKIKFVVRLIRQQNKKLKRFDKKMDNEEEDEEGSGGGSSSSILANCGDGGGGGGGRKKIMGNFAEESNGSPLDSPLPPARQAFQILHEEVCTRKKM